MSHRTAVPRARGRPGSVADPAGTGNQREGWNDQACVPSAARALLTVAASAALVLVGAPTAGAHVEATPEAGAQAGGGPVSIAFSAEAESASAGIASIRTQLPAGVPPDSVSLAGGPAGWTLSPTADGYDISGPPLAPGTDAEFTVAIERLPADATVLVFKTLVRYTDGQEDAWIEEPTPGNPEPASPAPVVTVAPAATPTASPSTTTATATATATTTASPATPSSTPSAQVADDDGTSAWPFVVGALVVVGVGGGLAFWRLRARSRS